jgi:transketolase N-terminal domain/subunit
MAATTELVAENPALAQQVVILARPMTLDRRMADVIRALAIDATEAAKSGHPDLPMGKVDVAATLWTRFHEFDAADPHRPDRDRFVLTAGHGSMLLYALTHLTGHAGMTIEDIRNFRQLDSPAGGHPEHGDHPAVETTAGPLGQGIATAVGMALAERMMAARIGKSLVDHRTWVIASDGDMMEGISHEAGALAGRPAAMGAPVVHRLGAGRPDQRRYRRAMPPACRARRCGLDRLFVGRRIAGSAHSVAASRLPGAVRRGGEARRRDRHRRSGVGYRADLCGRDPGQWARRRGAAGACGAGRSGLAVARGEGVGGEAGGAAAIHAGWVLTHA